ncbi:phosphotransferase family protein [Salinifilum ghardaiensis]
MQHLLATTVPAEPAHGDGVPPNILLTGEGIARLVDWEFAGLRRAGWDLALLHTLLTRTPVAQHLLAEHATTSGVWDGFPLQRSLAIAREVRIHTALPDGPLRNQRLALLSTAWRLLTADLHREATPVNGGSAKPRAHPRKIGPLRASQRLG